MRVNVGFFILIMNSAIRSFYRGFLMSKKEKISKIIFWTTLVIYILLILYVTLFGSRSSGFLYMLNLVPFKTIKMYLTWIFDDNSLYV